ncbi:MAG: type II toxin-antitoxin system PemK/MazF family toxin [Holophagaceae bacterium]
MRRRIPQRGDVYWVNPNPVAGREMKDRHPFVVITPKEINAFGVCMMVPVTSGGAAARSMGLTVPIHGHQIQGVAVCHQVRSFDLAAREADGTASYVESLDAATAFEIVNRVISVIEPA